MIDKITKETIVEKEISLTEEIRGKEIRRGSEGIQEQPCEKACGTEKGRKEESAEDTGRNCKVGKRLE